MWLISIIVVGSTVLVTFFRCAFVVWWHRRCRAGSWRGRCSARRRRRPTAGSQRPRGSRRRTRRPSHCRACNPWLKRDWTTSTGTGTILVDDKRTTRQAHTGTLCHPGGEHWNTLRQGTLLSPRDGRTFTRRRLHVEWAPRATAQLRGLPTPYTATGRGLDGLRPISGEVAGGSGIGLQGRSLKPLYWPKAGC